LFALSSGCAHARPAKEITRERAIAIARTQVRFEPFDASARRVVTNQRAVWRVVMKGRLPGQPPMLFETAVVEIDAATGAVVSLTKT
jgi:hypothetical protein